MIIRGKWVSLTVLVYGVIALIATILSAKISYGFKYGLMAITLILASIIYYFDVHRPVQLSYSAKMKILQNQMPFFLELATDQLSEDHNISQLRCNVMLAKRNIFRRWHPLKIDFYSGNYGKEEREQTYKYNTGCCGTALAEKGPIFFDTKTVQEPFKGLSATQRLVTKDVNSILSAPIFAATDTELKTPIAILNIDSKLPIEQTHFNEPAVYESVLKFAGLIASLIS
jgi:hypothetical protein